jgi:hypothetical protein
MVWKYLPFIKTASRPDMAECLNTRSVRSGLVACGMDYVKQYTWANCHFPLTVFTVISTTFNQLVES